MRPHRASVFGSEVKNVLWTTIRLTHHWADVCSEELPLGGGLHSLCMCAHGCQSAHLLTVGKKEKTLKGRFIILYSSFEAECQTACFFFLLQHKKHE